MSSAPQSGFYSTPTFELFRRGLQPSVISQFHGLNTYSTFPTLGPDWAQDLLNVIVSGSGGLSKLRLPVNLSAAIPGVNVGPNSFWDFQQGNGTRQVVAQFGTSLYYYTNDLANAFLIESNGLNAGLYSFAAANNILFGVNFQRAQKWTGQNWQMWGIAAPLNAPTLQAPIAGTLSPTVGLLYTYAYMNSVTGHVGNISNTSPSTGAGVNQAFKPLATAPTDPQDDTLVWFRTLDGGTNQFRLCQVNLATGVVTAFTGGALVAVTLGTGNLGITDNTPDNALDQLTNGPLINTPPLIGKYTAVGQGRVFIFNLQGAPQDFIYSGLEQIFLGRPEESFPPSNRLRLSIGAEEIAGGGILQAGVVAFSNTGRMYMLRGTLEDITLAVPLNFSAYLEELPWTLGCLSHYTIQSTPYGLIWVAGDKTLQMFDGHTEPIDISPAVYPLLRTITPGTENQLQSAYFNWLERDWYVLKCAVNGSQTINRLLFFAFNKAPGSDQLQGVEVFISDIPTRFQSSIGWVGLITSSKLQRMLCVSANGKIQQLPVSADTANGITTDFTITPPTNGVLNAYWRGGYFGQAGSSTLFRFGRLIADQDAASFQIGARYVDDDQFSFVTPDMQGPFALTSPRFALNRRAVRCAIEIDFPSADAPANVLELQMHFIPTSTR